MGSGAPEIKIWGMGPRVAQKIHFKEKLTSPGEFAFLLRVHSMAL